VFYYCQPVVNSYDPNDKHVLPEGIGPQGNIAPGQRLTYAIRFQNTGNATAFNIFILDTLDQALDLSTLQLLGASHPMELEVLPGNVLRFLFEDINLPDSTSNEPDSHGFVIYSIDPWPGLANGTSITNQADIFFDLNPAIRTNVTLNTLDLSLGDDEAAGGSSGLLLVPNPTRSNVQILGTFGNGERIQIIDSRGQTVRSIQTDHAPMTIDLSTLPAGLYLVRTQRSYARLIKE
jgi:uncharacterized repeat protein (TIGR01451 family)